MLKKIQSDILFICLVFFIAGVVYHEWLSFSVFAFADWGFGFSSVLKDFVFPATGGMFGSNIMLWKYPFWLINGIIGYFGFDYNVAEKITVFWPFIFITPLASYQLVKKITESSLAAFIGSLIFTYNTYFLSINTQGHVLLPLAYAWATLGILSFINLLESKKLVWIPITTILFFIVGSIDPRSVYVTAMIAVLYALYHQLILEERWTTELRKNVIRVFSVFFLLILLNLYWIFPALTVRALSGGDIFYRELFGNEFYNIQNSLAFFYPFWSGKEPTWMHLQDIPLLFWLYPVIAFAGIAANKQNKKVIFFGLLALVGVFLSKQSAEPFSQVYPWLFENIPGFAAFREASKFNFLIVIGYAVMIGSFVSYLQHTLNKRKVLQYLVISLIALLPLLNAIPLLTGEIKTLFIPKKIPRDFVLINQFMQRDKEYSRVMALNHNIYWSFATTNHQVTDAVQSLNYYWKDLHLYDTQTARTDGEKIVAFFETDEGRRLISSVSVKYVVVFIEEKQTNSNIRRDMGMNRTYFEESLGNIPYLEKQEIGLKNTLLYKNTEVKPSLYITSERENLSKDVRYKKADYTMINPTEFRIRLNNVSSSVFLNTINLYHPDWQLHIGDFNWYEVFFSSQNIISDKFHFENAVKESSFIIDPEYIKNNFDESSYLQNDDGSIDVTMTLYFRPQSYLYLGLLISGSVLIVLSLSMVYLVRKK